MACSSTTNDENGCEVINGKLSIFTEEGDSELVLESIGEALKEAMDEGEFNETHEDIVRVTYMSEEIPDEGTEEDSLNDSKGGTMTPRGDSDNLLTITLTTFSAAGVVLIAIGASLYRRRKQLQDNDDTTLQEGATVNGLSRFDVPATDTQDQDMDDTPLSPSEKDTTLCEL